MCELIEALTIGILMKWSGFTIFIKMVQKTSGCVVLVRGNLGLILLTIELSGPPSTIQI